GQMPLFRRLPKRGFNNKNFRRAFTIINVGELSEHFGEGETIDLAAVLGKGLVSKEKHTELFKILGNGDVSKKLSVKVDASTKSAREKIEAAGGSVELIPQREYRPKGVKKGQTVEVFRGTRYLGRAQILRSDPDRAVGRVIREFQQGQIQEGDDVATKLRVG
ncbi:MAG: 50S ribosomal protein L15, partial [Planctomycetota bacterium]